MLPSVLAASAGLGYVVVGWLLDRVAARYVMVVGALIAGLAFIVASRATSFAPMMVAYALLGLGISGATLIPASLVVASWFRARRGLVMSIVAAGASAGGMLMTVFAGHIIGRWGWRVAYVGLALPIFLILVPLLVSVVRNRPVETEMQSVSPKRSAEIDGFETGEAVGTRSFWMIMVAQLCFSLSVSGVLVHLVAYLVEVGYTAGSVALIMASIFGLNAVGKVCIGSFADVVGARIALFVNFVLEAIALLLALQERNVAVLIVFVPVLGSVLGAPIALVPLLIAECTGLKRFGSVSGLVGIASTVGAILGSIIVGRIFDLTTNYASALLVFSGVAFAGAFATLACRTYRMERLRSPVPSLAAEV